MEQGPKGREVILGERFFEQATKSAVPLDPVIVRTLRRSPLALDLYAWLTHRMATLEGTATVSWPALEAQFGSEYARLRDFRVKFRKQLAQVVQAWPGQLRVEAEDRRVVLDPGPPSVGAGWSSRTRSTASGFRFAPVWSRFLTRVLFSVPHRRLRRFGRAS